MNSKKRWFVVSLVLVVLILGAGVFLFSQGKPDKLQYGKYKISDCLYFSLASSVTTEKEKLKVSVVDVLEDSFRITYPVGTTVKFADVTYKKGELATEVIKQMETYRLPVSEYHSKTLYSVYRDNNKERYDLYLLDDTVWLIEYAKGYDLYSVSVLEPVD